MSGTEGVVIIHQLFIEKSIHESLPNYYYYCCFLKGNKSLKEKNEKFISTLFTLSTSTPHALAHTQYAHTFSLLRKKGFQSPPLPVNSLSPILSFQSILVSFPPTHLESVCCFFLADFESIKIRERREFGLPFPALFRTAAPRV